MKKMILLADDDATVREMLGRVLETEHYQVRFAATGREASAKFLADLPDLVLLDLNMPDRDGWDAFRVMHATHPLVPVVVITARPEQYGLAATLGTDAIMEKPLNLPLLLDAIASLVAETPLNRLRRLTDPTFKTAYLPHQAEAHAIGKHS